MSKPLFLCGEVEPNIVKVTTVTTAIISTCYIMSVLFHHYKQLIECISEVERIEAKVNNSKKKEWLTKKEEEREKEEVPTTTLDSYFIKISSML